jgi:hypothetical protein
LEIKEECRTLLTKAFSAFLTTDKTPEEISEEFHIPLQIIAQIASKQGWFGLRENYQMSKVLAGGELRTSLVVEMDLALVKAARDIAVTAGPAYVELIRQIEAMPISLEEAAAAEPVPDPVSGTPGPDADSASGQPAPGSKATEPEKKGAGRPRKLKPLVILKTEAMNMATEGFSNLVANLRNCGIALVMDTRGETPAGKGAGGALTPGNLTQINQFLVQAREGKVAKNVTPGATEV